MTIAHTTIHGLEAVHLESDFLRVSILPALGGKILSVFNKEIDKEFIWTNKHLLPTHQLPGADYDANFIGGIDELLPNDLPETVDGIDYPDHGELWTMGLTSRIEEDRLIMTGTLPLCELSYEKSIWLNEDLPLIHIDYRIVNASSDPRHFLWKLHAALNIEPGDQLVTSAKRGQVVDPGYSRFKNTEPFAWPVIEQTDASIVPAPSDAVDFFYLYDILSAEMKLINHANGHVFSYRYDPTIFPYQWYFASYGGFLDHYTAILEPCSAMPIRLQDAILSRQCSVLLPGQEINTSLQIFAGPLDQYNNL